MSALSWPFIEIDDQGIALVAGTLTKVIEVALDHIAHRWDAEEIHRQHPYLSLPQIHAALGYYFENQKSCDLLIEERLKLAEESRESSQNRTLVNKLKASRRSS